MATTSKQPIDIFLSYSQSDSGLSIQLSELLRARGMSVFCDSNPGGSFEEEQVWDAIAESRAIVFINPDIQKNPSQGYELGAAFGWRKPMYCVTSKGHDERDLTPLLRKAPRFDESELSKLAEEITQVKGPITDDETPNLIESYTSMKTPVEELISDGDKMEQLTQTFSYKSNRVLTNEQVLSKLLRLQKQGLLSSMNFGVKTLDELAPIIANWGTANASVTEEEFDDACKQISFYVFCLLRRSGMEQDEAERVVEKTLTDVVMYITLFEDQGIGSFARWCRQLAISYFPKSQLSAPAEMQFEQEDLGNAASMDRQATYGLLDLLSPQAYEVAVLRLIQNQPFNEIAHKLGITVENSEELFRSSYLRLAESTELNG